MLDADAGAIERTGLQLSEIRIGAGFTAGGDVGVASASVLMEGSFEFHPQDDAGSAAAAPSASFALRGSARGASDAVAALVAGGTPLVAAAADEDTST